MINKVILIGNLGQDPEIRKLDNGTAVCTIRIATNENYMDKNNTWQTLTEWHNVVLWRHLAERAEKFLKKGSMVFIEGKLATRKYQDQSGVDKYVTEVVARNLRILDKKSADGLENSSKPDDDVMNIDESGKDDLPF